jgi:hypothetical protein
MERIKRNWTNSKNSAFGIAFKKDFLSEIGIIKPKGLRQKEGNGKRLKKP